MSGRTCPQRRSLGRRGLTRVTRAAAWAAARLGAAGLAAGGLALPVLTAPAHAATSASASIRSGSSAHPISVNTLNWSGSAGFGSRAPAWYKDTSGDVHLQGAAAQTSTSGPGANTIGILPPAARPDRDVYTIVHTFNGTYADLEVATNGQLNLISPRPPAVTDYTFVSLEGISYTPANMPFGIGINTCCWSPDAGFGSGSPGYYTDKSGVVHLQGAVSEIPPVFDMIGIVAPPARPDRDVYTIVHTFNGTYADLEVATNGDINIIAPRSPAVTDFSFVSLEGITYRR